MTISEPKITQDYMADALKLAEQARDKGEVPVGAVIVHAPTSTVIASVHNLCEQRQDATAHAELLAIQQAQQHLSSKSLADCDLWVTLEPCAMCAGAIAHARIRRLYFGAYDEKGGAIYHGPCLFTHSTIHHQPDIYGGLSEQASADLLRAFFASKRKLSPR